MTFRRGDFRKNGGKWTGSSKKKGKKSYCSQAVGEKPASLRKASSSGADRT